VSEILKDHRINESSSTKGAGARQAMERGEGQGSDVTWIDANGRRRALCD